MINDVYYASYTTEVVQISAIRVLSPGLLVLLMAGGYLGFTSAVYGHGLNGVIERCKSSPSVHDATTFGTVKGSVSFYIYTQYGRTLSMSPRKCKPCPARAPTWQNISRSCKEMYPMQVHPWIPNDPTLIPYQQPCFPSPPLPHRLNTHCLTTRHAHAACKHGTGTKQTMCMQNKLSLAQSCTALTLTHSHTASSNKQRLYLIKICPFPPIDFHLHIEEWIYCDSKTQVG